jgi:hypothetical protein
MDSRKTRKRHVLQSLAIKFEHCTSPLEANPGQSHLVAIVEQQFELRTRRHSSQVHSVFGRADAACVARSGLLARTVTVFDAKSIPTSRNAV